MIRFKEENQLRLSKLLLVLIFTALIAVGCNKGPSTAEMMYDHLEKAVALEETFQEQQEPLVNLEQEEKALYDQIIDLGMKDIEENQKLTEDAIALIEQRRNLLEVEKESIEAAKSEFDKITQYISELETEELKTKAENLNETMITRYEAYQNLYDAYMTSLDYDEELYKLLQSEELSKEKLESQVEKINQSYEKVISANTAFNERTRAYNEQKREFYELADLNVKYPDQESSNE